MSQEKLQTVVMQTSWEVIEMYYGIVQVVNCIFKEIPVVLYQMLPRVLWLRSEMLLNTFRKLFPVTTFQTTYSFKS